MPKELEFDFDANVVEAVNSRLPAFKKFCARYPNNEELGAKLRGLTDEAKAVKKNTDFADFVLVLSGYILLSNIADILSYPKKKKSKKIK